MDDFVEVSKGKFISKQHYFNLTKGLGLKPNEISSYLDSHLKSGKRVPSLVGKPLFFQEKIEGE